MKKSHETGNSLQQNFHSGIGCLMRILLRYCMQFSRKFPTGTWCPKNFFPLYRDSNEFFASGIWYSLKNFAGNLVSQKYLTCIGRLWDEKFVCKVFLVLFFASYTILCRKGKKNFSYFFLTFLHYSHFFTYFTWIWRKLFKKQMRQEVYFAPYK